jgi:Ca2+-transporting ATPase
MTFAVMGLGTVLNALANRRDPGSGLAPPILKAVAIGLIPVAAIVLATRVDFLQTSLLTQPLTGTQWLVCIGLALPLALVIEVGKWIRRRRTPRPTIDARTAVAPRHARNERIGVAVND